MSEQDMGDESVSYPEYEGVVGGLASMSGSDGENESGLVKAEYKTLL